MLYKHRRLAAACFAGCVVAALIITVLTPRTYTASAQIQVARSSPIKLQLKDNVLDLDETERILNGASSFLSTQVQALRSRDVAERAIRTFRLAENPAFVESAAGGAALAAVPIALPAFLQPRGLPAPARRRDAAAGRPTVRSIRGCSTATWAISRSSDVRGTDLIEIRFTAPSPALAALLTAAHIQAYIGFVKESQITTDSTAKEFLAQQLDESRARLERAEAALAAFAAEHPDVAVNQEDELDRQADQADGRAGERRRGHAGPTAQSRVEFLAKAKREPLRARADENEAIPKLRLQLLDLQAQEAALKQRLGPNHSQMRDLRRQETELRLQIDDEVEAGDRGRARPPARRANCRRTSCAAASPTLEKKATALRSLGGQYEFLQERARQRARELHESLLKQKTDTAVHSELAASKVRVIERPEVPRYAASPRKQMNLLIGALAGLALAIGAAFFRESLDNSVKSSEEAEGLLQLPDPGDHPQLRPGARRSARAARLPAGRQCGRHARHAAELAAPTAQRTATPHGPRDDLVVVRRTVVVDRRDVPHAAHRAALLVDRRPPPQVILVTSAASGEGKTVTCAESRQHARRGRPARAADRRRPAPPALPRGARRRAAARPVELSRTATSSSSASCARSPSPHIAFISAGPPPANPAELVGSERMGEALAAAAQALRLHHPRLAAGAAGHRCRAAARTWPTPSCW